MGLCMFPVSTRVKIAPAMIHRIAASEVASYKQIKYYGRCSVTKTHPEIGAFFVKIRHNSRQRCVMGVIQAAFTCLGSGLRHGRMPRILPFTHTITYRHIHPPQYGINCPKYTPSRILWNFFSHFLNSSTS